MNYIEVQEKYKKDAKEKEKLNKTKKKKDVRNMRTNVRYGEEVYQKLKNAREDTGKSFATLFRDAFMKKPMSRPVFSHQDAKKILRELSRIGNNINQISRRVNQGVFYGWYPELDEMHAQLVDLGCYIVNYGPGKK